MPTPAKTAVCPCGGPSFAACCARYIEGAAIPDTAQALMRSRYTAYTQRNESYLLATWHPSSRPTDALFADEEKLTWLGLEIKSALRLRQRKAELPETSEEDTVEFVARYKIGGRAHRLHEVSRFVRESGSDGVLRWFYLDGSFPE